MSDTKRELNSMSDTDVASEFRKIVTRIEEQFMKISVYHSVRLPIGVISGNSFDLVWEPIALGHPQWAIIVHEAGSPQRSLVSAPVDTIAKCVRHLPTLYNKILAVRREVLANVESSLHDGRRALMAIEEAQRTNSFALIPEL